jgi:Secretion system C-terminal sorting domain/Photosynthesis system II assembly factor YCF48
MKKLLLSILTFTAVFNIANAQWVKQDTAFTGGPIPVTSLNANDLFAVDANVVWAMSERPGTAASPQFFSKQWSKTTDGGATWTHGTIGALSDTNWRASNLTATDANHAYALFYGDNATSYGGLYQTADGGATWTLANIAWAGVASSFPNVVHFFDANNGMVMGDPAGVEFEIFTTSDAGATWTAVPAANKPNIVSGEFGIVDVYDAVGDTIYFGTNKGRVYKSVDKGLNWTVSQAQGTTIFMSRVVCKSGTEIICSGAPTGGTVTTYRKSTNGGTNWSTVAPSGTFFTNGYTYVPAGVTTPGFWMSYGATAGFANYGHSVSSDFTSFTKADSIFQYQMDVVDANTAYGVGRYSNTTGLNAFEKITNLSSYSTFLGLNNISKSNAKVGIMPNPSNGIFSVISENLKSTVKVTLTDVMGKVVSNETLTNTGDFKLDYSAKNKGIYFLTISDNVSTLTQRIVIQ